MRFAVIGAGGVGAYFGGRLAQAGFDVTFVARGKHLEAILARGLRVESSEGDFVVEKATATEDLASLGDADLVILGVKTWQVAETAAALAPVLRGDASVLTLQNGVEAPEEVSNACGRARVIPGVCRIMSFIVEPGLVRHAGVRPTVSFGEPDGTSSRRVQALKAAFDRCSGVAATLSHAIERELWEKFLFIAPFSALGAVTRKPAGRWRDVPETRALLRQAMEEVVTLAGAHGVALPPDAIERTLAFTDRLLPEATASMQRDLLEGRPSELEAQTGAIVRLGRLKAVATPANNFLYAALRPAELLARRL